MGSVVGARRRFAVLAAVIAVGVSALSACTSSDPPPEQVAAQKYLDALGAGEAAQAAALSTNSNAGPSIELSLDGLGEGSTGMLKVTGLSAQKSESATAAYSASWTIPGISTPWKFTGSLPMVKNKDTWLVSWSPATIHPKLTATHHLVLTRSQPQRAEIQDVSGKAIFAKTPVVVVGIKPSDVKDLASLATTLAQTLNISAEDIIAGVKAAKPDAFVTVITLRATYYESVKDVIHDLPGTVFREETQVLPPASGWGQPWLGSVGVATKEVIDSSAGRIKANDLTGLSGLQRSYDKQLSGTTGVQVQVAADKDEAVGATIAKLVAAKPGTPVKLTIDSAAQSAAETTLDTVTQPASIVALQPSTGKILAIANSPSTTSNIAMIGQFPAGSDFKIVTYAAAFSADPSLTPATPSACPGTITIDGREFENQDKFDKGTVSVADAFAYSCNTTAIEQAMKLPTDALPKAATALGLGATWDLPVDSFSGSLPDPKSPTEQAANAIGQGSVLVSPLAMASVAGAAASGTAMPVSMLAGAPAAAGTAIDAKVSANLNTLMKGVVEQPFGTAHALAGLPGGVQGKTGTAEFGTDTPPKSHSWMVGTRGDLAFAVFVYGGESSHDAAVPITASFLSAYS